MSNRFEPKTILVPMDGSECSRRAWEHAVFWADAANSKTQALYIHEPLRPARLDIDQETVLKNLHRQAAGRIREQIGPKAPLLVKQGKAEIAIIKTAEESGAGFIIMGTHGRHVLDRAFLGSVAEDVIRHSTIPVLTTKSKFSSVNSILVPVNFTPYAKAAAHLAFQMAQVTKADVSLLHVLSRWSRLNEASDQFDDLILGLPRELTQGINIQRLAQIGNPVETIIEESLHYDLIVLSAHRKKLLKEYILGSTAERTLRYCPVPILAVPWYERRRPQLLKRPGARAQKI
ncbi:MAG: universal stress protein [Elusimicrobia bacterium]|nr:universal stress protein [Elusimicrobiota bacterium]